MKTMEQIIREKGREQFYDYYRSLGYTEKTAAVLTLFTYGDYRYTDLTIDAVYEALLHGEEYLPQELQELRRHPYASPMRYTGPLTGSSMPRAAGGTGRMAAAECGGPVGPRRRGTARGRCGAHERRASPSWQQV